MTENNRNERIVERYVVTGMYDPDSFSVDWDIIPDEFLNYISRNLYNVPALTSSGDIIEKTVVFLRPVEEFSRNAKTIDIVFEDGSIIIGKE